MSLHIDLAAIEDALAKAPEIQELQADPSRQCEDISWQSEVMPRDEEFGRWSALFTTVFCALLHLPALALESCWPSLLGQGFRFSPERRVLLASHWIALGSTIVLLGLNKGFLFWGAETRRGFAPLVFALAGSWFVILNPVYFLLADYSMLHTRHATECIVLFLTVFGLLLLIWACAWNASLDRIIAQRYAQSQTTRAMSSRDWSTADAGVHVLVDQRDLD